MKSTIKLDLGVQASTGVKSTAFVTDLLIDFENQNISFNIVVETYYPTGLLANTSEKIRIDRYDRQAIYREVGSVITPAVLNPVTLEEITPAEIANGREILVPANLKWTGLDSSPISPVIKGMLLNDLSLINTVLSIKDDLKMS